MDSQSPFSTLPQIKGYRILQRVNNDNQQSNLQSINLKVTIQNSSNGIPRIRHDVICHGKLYPLIPLFTFTSQDDLKIIQQLSAIVLKDQNQILCDILSKKITEVKSDQYLDLKQRMKSIFGLQLKIQPQQLFLIVISEQISSQKQFNEIMDSISETEFVSLIKNIYENCTKRLIPKILRKFNKYFNSTQSRPKNSIERLKRYLKIARASQEDVSQEQEEQKIQKITKKSSTKQIEKKIVKKQSQVNVIQQKTLKNDSKEVTPMKTQIIVKKQSKKQKQISKRTIDTERIQTKPALKKQTKNNNNSPFKSPQQEKVNSNANKNTETAAIQHQQDWHDESSDENQDIEDTIQNMAYDHDDEQDLKYQGPKKKNNKKQKNNITIPLDPELQRNPYKKVERLNKQKNNKNSHSNDNLKSNLNGKNNYQNNNQNLKYQQNDDNNRNNGRNRSRNNNEGNRSDNNSFQKGGRREFSQQNKKIDPRILLGINGASDSVWRQRIRPVRIPKQDTFISSKKSFQNNSGKKENRQPRSQKTNNQSLIVTKITQNTEQTVKKNKEEITIKKNLKLQRVYCFPDDVSKGKTFLFENKNYNIFVNKLFWINITAGQVTIQKEGKGYIRKCNVEIIDGGKGIMAQGLTLNIDGLSNLQDGGTPFGDPNFQQFTPDGQWFHINSLEIYAYV